MLDRYDVISVREYQDRNGNKKSSWTKLGVAFKSRNGDGYMIQLDAMPASTDGTYRLHLRPPQAKDEPRRQAPATSGSAHDDLSDSIPF